MDHIDTGLRGLLKYPIIYDLFLKLIGYYNVMEILSNEYILAKSGQTILDIGCGSSLILNWLPKGIKYFGYDLNINHISHNQKKYANHTFFCKRVSEMSSLENDSYDIALAISLIHHLNDLEAYVLFNSIKKTLKPGGRFITYDPVWTYREGKLESLIKRNDRGRNIRDEDHYLKFARGEFKNITLHIRNNMGWHFPATVAIVVCQKEAQ